MNRAIKFRAWDRVNERMLQNVAPGTVTYFDHGLEADHKDCELMQFTGLLDKNGKEIYEGDLLRVWIQGDQQDGFYQVEDMRELYLQVNHADSYYRMGPLEVIGNIYENSDLLV